VISPSLETNRIRLREEMIWSTSRAANRTGVEKTKRLAPSELLRLFPSDLKSPLRDLVHRPNIILKIVQVNPWVLDLLDRGLFF
jgi:hypothetical protein